MSIMTYPPPARAQSGAGAPNRVTIWSPASLLTYDDLLQYDAATHILTVSQLVLTTPLALGYGGSGATTAAQARSNFGLGSIATQAASNVTITGGTLLLPQTPTPPLLFGGTDGQKIQLFESGGVGNWTRFGIGMGSNRMQLYTGPTGIIEFGRMSADGTTFTKLITIQGSTLTADFEVIAPKITSPDLAGEFQGSFGGFKTAGTNRWNLYIQGTAQNYLQGTVGIGIAGPRADTKLHIVHPKLTQSAMLIQANDTDAVGAAVYFLSVAGPACGGIFTTATTTSYGTTSDARLKMDVEPLTEALPTVQALNPITFCWRSTGERAHGFLAHEVQRLIGEAVSGTPDAVDEAGEPVYQQMDASKLIPWLVAALKELTTRVVALEGGAA